MNKRPIVGITMGDPAGNGPEITVKALADASLYDRCRPLVVGDIKAFQQAAGFVGHPEIKFNKCEKVSDALFEAGTIDVLHMDLIEDISRFEIGKVSVEGGNAKEALNKALAFYKGEKSDGHLHFDGHTEIYATYTGTKKYAMMLAHHDLRVVHVSTHVSLREACDRVKTPRVLECIEIADKACRDMGIENPKVAALRRERPVWN